LLIVKAMFIKEREPEAVERFSMDNYNKVSMLVCTLGILIVGVLSYFYQSIGGLTFGI